MSYSTAAVEAARLTEAATTPVWALRIFPHVQHIRRSAAPQGEKSVLHIYLSTYFLIFYRQGRARNIHKTPFVSFRYKDRDKKGGRRYIIPDTIYKISERPVDYTLSSGLRRFSPIFRKWLGVSPVTFLNWALKWAVLE